MIVCHCSVVSDRDVAAAVDAGAASLGGVCRATTAGRDCGACVFTVRRLVCEHVAERQDLLDMLMEVDGAAS